MGSGDFYTTAAQVIPLIFVAIAFEGRAIWKPELWEKWAISPHAMSWIRMIHMSMTTFALVIGETAALWALGHDASVSFEAGYPGWIIGWCLGIGGMALIAQVVAQVALELFGGAEGASDEHRARVASRTLLGLIVLGFTAGVGYLAWSIVTSLSN
ncbi:MAG TPA: hypothetical protein VF729_08585 [Solirubrobacterales bacterium]